MGTRNEICSAFHLNWKSNIENNKLNVWVQTVETLVERLTHVFHQRSFFDWLMLPLLQAGLCESCFCITITSVLC